MNSIRRVFKLMCLTALALLLLAACQNEDEATTDSAAPEATVDVDTVSVTTGVGFVSAEGVVVPLRSANLSFQTGGTVTEV